MDAQINNCETCFKIICRNCNWQANKQEADEITKGNLKNCPKCGWRPNN